MNKEVEIKGQITEEEFSRLENLLKDIAIFKQQLIQTDTYLDHPSLELYGAAQESKSFRVRKSTDQNSLCLKVMHKGDLENNFYRDEYQIQIDDADKTLKMLQMLGFCDVKILGKVR